MLSLIPALLLLAFHGPSAVERFGHEGRLPEALRALERVWAPQEADADGEGVGPDKQRRALASLVAMAGDPAFSRAVSQLFGLELEVLDDSDKSDLLDVSDDLGRATAIYSEIEGKATQDGLLNCRRSRDGPLA
jgi:hypothetical protein